MNLAAVLQALRRINAERGLSVVIADLTDPQPVTVHPARPGDYLVAPCVQAEYWTLAHFDGSRWCAPDTPVGADWVWCGLTAPVGAIGHTPGKSAS